MKTNQKGSSVVTILIAIGALILIGTAGFLVYRSRSNNKAPSPSTTAKAPITTFAQCAAAGNAIQESFPEKCSANGQTFTNTPTDDGYLHVYQWGVKIKMADAAKATYVFDAKAGSNSVGSYETGVTLAIKPELLQDKNCKTGVSMYRTNDPSTGSTSFVKKGSYYYFESSGAPTCTNTSDRMLVTNLIAEFKTANVTTE